MDPQCPRRHTFLRWLARVQADQRLVARGTQIGLIAPLIAACASPVPTSPTTVPIGSASPNASELPSEPSIREADDMTMALGTATRFEAARAANRWGDAWNLLAPASQIRIGSLARFAEGEAAFNAQGGSTFQIQRPTQDAASIQLYVGAMRPEIELVADINRGYLIFIAHPDVQAASAGSRSLFVAPLDGVEWRIWIVH